MSNLSELQLKFGTNIPNFIFKNAQLFLANETCILGDHFGGHFV